MEDLFCERFKQTQKEENKEEHEKSWWQDLYWAIASKL